MSQPISQALWNRERSLELTPMEAMCPLMLTSYWMRAVPEEGMYFRKYDSLEPRVIPKERLHCDPSAASAPGSWGNEHIDPQRSTWEAQHSTLYTDYTYSPETCSSLGSMSWRSILFSSKIDLILFNGYIVFQKMMYHCLWLVDIQVVPSSLLSETIL